jgi:methyl-accepting chemotaxis protein PixJ
LITLDDKAHTMTQMSSDRPVKNSIQPTTSANADLFSSPNSREPSSTTKTLDRLPEAKIELTKAANSSQIGSWWQSISIRAKATALAIAISTVPMLAIGGIVYSVIDRVVKAQTEEFERAQVVELQDKVNRFMIERFGDIQIIAKLSILTDPGERASATAQEKATAFDDIAKIYGYDSIAFTDLEGDVIVQTKGNPLGNLYDRQYIQAALKAKGAVLGNPALSPTSGEFSIYAASLVKDKVTGQPIGFVRTRMPVKRLEQLVQGFGVEGSQHYLIDGSGAIFLGPEGVYVQPILATGDIANNSQDDYKRVTPDLIFPGLSGLKTAKQISIARSQNVKTNTEQLIAYAPPVQLSGLPDLGWQAIIATDTSILFAPQRQLLLSLTLGTGITTLLMSAIAADIANRATRPIRLAASAVQKIGQGDLETRLEIEGADEIGILGVNINNMAAQLQNSLATQAFEAEQEQLVTMAKGAGVLRSEDLQNIFDQTLKGTRKLFNFDRIVIYRFDTDTQEGIVSESVADGWPRALNQGLSDSCIPEETRAAYRAGQLTINNDVSQAGFNLEHMQLLERLQVKASAIVPILGSNQLFGLLIAHSCSATHDWQDAEVNFLKRLGTELGLSLYRVELLETTTGLAAEQRQLKEELQQRALELLQEVDPISRGDLTTRAKVTADEIGTIADSYNATVDNLRKIVLQVQGAANQVVETASFNEISIQNLSGGALRQAEEIAAVLALVSDMADAVQTVSDNAEQAEMAVQQATQTVEEGEEVMNRTVAGIQVIRTTVADTAKKVKHLGESSQKISKVVELISTFAAQTNMLALNASIEASRAGEEGRGFAVVANEVRALARQSAEATEEIRSLVSSIQVETNEVVAAMESGIEQVVTGTKLVDETRQSLNKITAVSAQISELVGAIALSTVVQSQASETVTETMRGVAAIANQTSTEVIQVSSSLEDLKKVAQTLKEGVGQFKVS